MGSVGLDLLYGQAESLHDFGDLQEWNRVREGFGDVVGFSIRIPF